MYTVGFYRLRYPQSRLQQKRHNNQPLVSSHAMPTRSIATDVSLYMISSKKGGGKFISRSWELELESLCMSFSFSELFFLFSLYNY